MATPSDFAGAAQELAQARRECGVAGIDGVLSIADEMSEADLMILLGPIHLGREPVGNPEIGTVFAQELFDHGSAAVGMNDETGVLGVMEDPGPTSPLSDAHTGLVRLQDGAGEQAFTDQARSARERKLTVVEHVDKRAFADFKLEQIGEQPRKPLERYRLGEAQVDGESPQVRPERRARFKPRWRRSLEWLGAARAQAAEQCHPC